MRETESVRLAVRITEGLETRDEGLETTDYGLRTTDYGPLTTDYGLRSTNRGVAMLIGAKGGAGAVGPARGGAAGGV